MFSKLESQTVNNDHCIKSFFHVIWSHVYSVTRRECSGFSKIGHTQQLGSGGGFTFGSRCNRMQSLARGPSLGSALAGWASCSCGLMHDKSVTIAPCIRVL